MSMERLTKIEAGMSAVFERYIQKVQPLPVSSGLIKRDKYLSYMQAAIEESLNNRRKCMLISNFKSGGEYFALLKQHRWESDFFQMPIGYIDIIFTPGKMVQDDQSITLVNHCLELAKEWGLYLVYIRINASRFSLIQAIQYVGFQFIFTELNGVYGEQELAQADVDDEFLQTYTIQDFLPEDTDELLSIGKEFCRDIVSRFSLTPSLPREKVNRYYYQTVANACQGKYGDVFHVLKNQGKVCGFNLIISDKVIAEQLGRNAMFCALFGLKRSERKKGVGIRFSCGSQQKLFKDKVPVIYRWRASISNKSLMDSNFRRSYTPHINFMHTFAFKL